MPIKPLGIKSYGSIPHLPGSRLGPGDHHCEQGQSNICLVKTRDKHDVVIVQEKLDGSNVGVGLKDGIVVPLIRSGYAAAQSYYKQHHWFHDWVMERQDIFQSILKEGERICGEWLAQAHGTLYKPCDFPFYAFDMFTADNKRFSFDMFMDRLNGILPIPQLLHKGSSLPLEEALKLLGEHGHHGAVEPVEGVVYRVENRGKVDFLAKFVHHWKEDGKYLNLHPEQEIYNWVPERLR